MCNSEADRRYRFLRMWGCDSEALLQAVRCLGDVGSAIAKRSVGIAFGDVGSAIAVFKNTQLIN
ncbi:hypothetical protein IQ226_04600 [Dolichospermum sp. LEGE 00240]|uniref:hypothetical protein n=1 Tax=Dolichospermum sp. LEGE 00240 TaxID=1828603 RepID=UPI0018813746|nr:hypothetical protein [Dolichospermum sp. LEGE 00240]MBE9248481.1 hypothetical protein [Dolichospermum sp. LEGE 00240]MDM3844455.1 hypothetical protein [Aphanizomenon gracile PMC638.10]MDM3851963.1 hypothetical protein [Aphanizomenon gracile PMC627.10]